MTYKLKHPEAKPPSLDKSKVPKELDSLIPVAEKYGISDDSYRSDMIQSLSEKEKTELCSKLEKYEGELDEWLSGPEADGPSFSKEYITFSALRMCVDEIN